LEQLHGINDAQLHALLERVRAKYVTKSISLDRSAGRVSIIMTFLRLRPDPQVSKTWRLLRSFEQC
jgi:hypothetical protein